MYLYFMIDSIKVADDRLKCSLTSRRVFQMSRQGSCREVTSLAEINYFGLQDKPLKNYL